MKTSFCVVLVPLVSLRISIVSSKGDNVAFTTDSAIILSLISIQINRLNEMSVYIDVY